MAKKALRVSVSITLAIILLAFFLKNVDLSEVGHTLRDANLHLIVVTVLLSLLSYWLRTVRWQFILRSAGNTRHLSALLAIAVGYAAMALLPARAGDIVRPVVLARRDRIPTSAALASMVTERLFDLMTVILFFLVFVLWPPAMSELSEQSHSYLEILGYTGYAAAAFLILAATIVLALFRYQERFVEILTRPVKRFKSGWAQPFANFLNHFLDGLRVLQRPRDLLITTAMSLLLWYVIYWQVSVTLMAFDLFLPLRATFLLVTLAVIGLAIPTPGGVGGFHKATQIGLTAFFGVELNRATGVAIAYHAVSFLPITVIGLLCLPLLGVSIREVGSMTADDEEATP